MDLGSTALWDNTDNWEIGRLDASNGYYWTGYMDEIAIYVGIVKYNPVATGLGTATVTPSYLSDPTGNHFTTSGLAITDQMLDTPENNFCIMNPIDRNDHGMAQTVVHSAGVKIAGASAAHDAWNGSLGFSTGKWYWEDHKIDTSG